MSKLLVKLSDDRDATVFDGDTLDRFIATARAAAEGDRDAVEVLPPLAWYIAQRLADVEAARP